MDVLLAHVVDVAQNMCISLLPRVNEVKAKFKPLFTRFGKCHNIYNGNVIEKSSADQLGKGTSYLGTL